MCEGKGTSARSVPQHQSGAMRIVRSVAVAAACAALCTTMPQSTVAVKHAAQNATVHGRAQPFIKHDGLANAKITCEEFPELTAVTDASGLFQLDAPVGENLTLTLTHPDTRTTTAATFTVPAEGIPAGE